MALVGTLRPPESQKPKQQALAFKSAASSLNALLTCHDQRSFLSPCNAPEGASTIQEKQPPSPRHDHPAPCTATVVLPSTTTTTTTKGACPAPAMRTREPAPSKRSNSRRHATNVQHLALQLSFCHRPRRHPTTPHHASPKNRLRNQACLKRSGRLPPNVSSTAESRKRPGLRTTQYLY